MPEYDFKPLNLAQLYSAADASVAQAMQTNLLVLQSSRMKQEFDREDQLRALAKKSTSVDETTGETKFDLKSYAQGAYSIDPMKAPQIAKAQLEAQKTTLENENVQGQIDERRMKMAAERLKVMNEASTVPLLKYRELLKAGKSDEEARAAVQPMYEQALHNVVMSGFFKPEQMKEMKIMNTPQFDPTVAETAMGQTLGAKDALAKYWEERRQSETERHNAETEKQARAALTQAQNNHLDTLRSQGKEVKQNEDGSYVVIDKTTNEATPVMDPATGKPLGGKSNLTESQGKALGFGQRAVAAHNLILGLEASGTYGIGANIKQGVDNLPVVGGVAGAVANKMLPADQQKYEQAQRDFINAAMRPESGATITPAEFENAKKQYFPQAGDSAAVIKQKQEAREREIETLKAMAGPGAKQFPAVTKPKGKEKEGGAAPAGAVTVTAPDGKTYTFPDQAAADKFKAAAGIK